MPDPLIYSIRVRLKQLLTLTLAALMVVANWSCEKQEDSAAFVRTEDILYVSGEQLIITGRLISTTVPSVTDHGFQISSNENFSDATTISLGPIDRPGRFVGETSTLQIETDYFVRAYAELDGAFREGNILSFRTLFAVVDGFSPRVGRSGAPMIIRGSNFTADTKVFFDDLEAIVNEILNESTLLVTIPAMKERSAVSVKVVSQDKSLTFDTPFEYIIGIWEKAGEFPLDGNSYYAGVEMQNDEEVLLGLGVRNSDMELNSAFFRLDLETDSWSTVPFTGFPVTEPFTAWPYFGGGAVTRVPAMRPSIALSSQFWKYTGEGFERQADLPFQLYQAVAGIVGNQLLVFGGVSPARDPNFVVYAYDLTNRTWTDFDFAPIEIDSRYPHFFSEGKAHFLRANGVLHSFDPANSQWSSSRIVNFVGQDGFSQLVGDELFFGLYRNSFDVWGYSLTDGVVRQKTRLDSRFTDPVAISWQEDGLLYLLKNRKLINQQPMEIWSLNPKAF